MDDSIRDLQVLKQHLISSHERDQSVLRSCRPGSSIFGTYDQKPSTPGVSLNGLSPIHCQSLAPNTVHFGRVLRGTLVVDPQVIIAAHTVIEDEAGGLARVSIYNFAPDDLDQSQRTCIAGSLFRNGKKVAIAEPFYKNARDGNLMVRVKNFAEDVIFPEHFGPRCSEDWRAEGKVHFTNQQIREAIYSYKRSIATHDQSKLAAVLLSNVATCLMLKELYGPSLLLAVASFVVDNSLFRPFYTAGFCLKHLNHKNMAFKCLEQCQMLNAPSKLCRHLEEGLGDTTEEQIPAFEWNEKVLCLVASEPIHDLLQINSNDATDSRLLKDKGNVLFKKQQHDEAIRAYCTALRGILDVASLLTNLSLCYAKIGNHAEAALYASAAILIDPDNAKAHYWKSISLLQLNRNEEARKSCNTALDIVSDNADIIGLRERIKCACMASSLNESYGQDGEGPYLREQEKQTERKQEEQLQKHNMSTAVVAMSNKILALTGLSEDVDDRVKPFHLEFSREGEWPVECDTHSGMELLTRAYENARTPSDINQIHLESPSVADIALLCKRLNSKESHVLNWWFRAPLKSLSPRKRNSYASSMHHSFTNSPRRANVLLFGTVHVSVGFVDLSELLFSELKSSAGQSGPLRWIGYEASAYSVAKSVVIAHMIRHQADTDCILQVWFSSSWSKKTLGSFRRALHELINRTKGTKATAYSAEVVSLWQHWHQFDISLRTARSQWLSRHNLRNQVEISNFRRKIDRLAVCRYLVSGELLESEVGSVVMFGLPSTARGDEYEIALDEWFLHCLPLHNIVKEVDMQTDFIEAAICILRKHIFELKDLVSTGAVVIEMQHKTVKLSDGSVIREIRKSCPRSISWSNLCDYCTNKVFHKMARACSGDDTTHYLSSVNWSPEVKGTFLIDHPIDVQKKLLKEATDIIELWYQLNGLTSYLHMPPITHHYNIGSHLLCGMMKETWTENFFKAARLEDLEKQVVVELVNFDVLARTQSTIHMIYTFRKDKQLIGYDV